MVVSFIIYLMQYISCDIYHYSMQQVHIMEIHTTCWRVSAISRWHTETNIKGACVPHIFISSCHTRITLCVIVCRWWPSHFITLTSWWARRRLKSPASLLFAEPFVQAQINKNQSVVSLASVSGIHWWPVDSPHKGQERGKYFLLMTSSCAGSGIAPS